MQVYIYAHVYRNKFNCNAYTINTDFTFFWLLIYRTFLQYVLHLLRRSENAHSFMALVHTSNFLEVRVCSAHVLYVSFRLLFLSLSDHLFQITNGKP